MIESLVSSITYYIRKSSYKTIEALSQSITDFIFKRYSLFTDASLYLEKPNAISTASSAGIQLFRKNPFLQNDSVSDSLLTNVVYLAIGSNVGERLTHIYDALTRMKSNDMIKLLDTSFMYESKPMYILDQANFLNCVIRVNLIGSFLSSLFYFNFNFR
jgi:dihydroneopterin aldolase/2-amino-4-hydroxy-6-hydroxymethyldihydropteridine diphosphokinase/dihydropteroate synthase